MTAEPHPVDPAPLPDLSTPRGIRAALLPEEVGEFDSAWRGALARAAEALDLSEVHDVLDSWRRNARLTLSDPEAHRRMLARAERSLAGGPVSESSVGIDEIRALIRRRLGS